jgi:hypothetical protein
MASDKQTPGIGKGAPGPGRKKGIPNKLTSDVKAMILEALDRAGGTKYLLSQAHENPKAFLSLLGRVIPLQVQGDPENPLYIAKIERRVIDPK